LPFDWGHQGRLLSAVPKRDWTAEEKSRWSETALSEKGARVDELAPPLMEDSDDESGTGTQVPRCEFKSGDYCLIKPDDNASERYWIGRLLENPSHSRAGSVKLWWQLSFYGKELASNPDAGNWDNGYDASSRKPLHDYVYNETLDQLVEFTSVGRITHNCMTDIQKRFISWQTASEAVSSESESSTLASVSSSSDGIRPHSLSHSSAPARKRRAKPITFSDSEPDSELESKQEKKNRPKKLKSTSSTLSTLSTFSTWSTSSTSSASSASSTLSTWSTSSTSSTNSRFQDNFDEKLTSTCRAPTGCKVVLPASIRNRDQLLFSDAAQSSCPACVEQSLADYQCIVCSTAGRPARFCYNHFYGHLYNNNFNCRSTIQYRSFCTH
jgi:hypothetical protein